MEGVEGWVEVEGVWDTRGGGGGVASCDGSGAQGDLIWDCGYLRRSETGARTRRSSDISVESNDRIILSYVCFVATVGYE